MSRMMGRIGWGKRRWATNTTTMAACGRRMMMGLKVMAAKGGSQDKEMEEMASKIQRRIEIYYKNRMKPVLRALAKEQG